MYCFLIYVKHWNSIPVYLICKTKYINVQRTSITLVFWMLLIPFDTFYLLPYVCQEFDDVIEYIEGYVLQMYHVSDQWMIVYCMFWYFIQKWYLLKTKHSSGIFFFFLILFHIWTALLNMSDHRPISNKHTMEIMTCCIKWFCIYKLYYNDFRKPLRNLKKFINSNYYI